MNEVERVVQVIHIGNPDECFDRRLMRSKYQGDFLRDYLMLIGATWIGMTALLFVLDWVGWI